MGTIRGTNDAFGRAVLIPNDDLVPSALLSGGILRQHSPFAPVVALISTRVSSKNTVQLKSVFDFIIFTKTFEMDANNFDESDQLADLMVECLNLTFFSKLIVFRPGILNIRQSDELFDTLGIAAVRNGHWCVIVIQPNSEKYIEALQLTKGQSYSHDELLEVLFGQAQPHHDSEHGRVISYSEFGRFIGVKDEIRFLELEKNTAQLFVQNDDIDGLVKPKDVISNVWKTTLEGKLWRARERIISSSARPHSPHSQITCPDTKNWIAIVGMACRFPQANSIEEYWDILHSGRATSSSPPPHRIPLAHIDSDVKGNFLKCRIDEFDAPFFNIPPSEAAFTDAQTRLVLEVSWEAFEDAGISPSKLRNTKTGVFYGSWLQEYKEAINMESGDAGENFLRKYMGNGFGCTAAKLSFFYGFTGPNIATESGCSSSIMAVDLACKYLQSGDCPLALAAGANILLQMNLKGKVVWSEDGLCRTFDASGNGYGRAEGVGVLVMKRYADAIRDGDQIQGIIRGTASSQEGLSRSFGTPTIENETATMRTALISAKVDPSDVDCVEAHATGTGVGDPIEAAAIVNAYSSKKPRLNPLWIASGKTNIGHTESCSGIAGIIKVLMAMRNEIIPAHLNLEKLNPKINFDSIPGEIPVTSKPWKRDEGRPRLAGVSSFGITGTDVHIILQEGPTPSSKGEVKDDNTPTFHVMTFSTKCESALEDLTTSYLNYLRTCSHTLADIAYTATTCRAHHSHRRAIVGRSVEMLANDIEAGSFFSGKINSSKSPKICFVFPGLIGSMNMESVSILYHTSPIFKENMDYCEEVLMQSLGVSMLSYLSKKASPDDIGFYSCILAVQYSLVKLWEFWGVKPTCVMGHCVGELAAAIVSGSLQIEDGLKMLFYAGDRFMEESKLSPSSMLALNCDADEGANLISTFLEQNLEGSWIDVAGVNSRRQTVVVGPAETILAFRTFCEKNNVKSKVIPVHIPLHSRGAQSALENCMGLISKLNHRPHNLPHFSSVTGNLINVGEELTPEYWYKCFRNPVQFTHACSAAEEFGCDIYIEIGLGGAISKLLEENKSQKVDSINRLYLSCFNNKGDKCWSGLCVTLAHLYSSGVDIDWDAFYQFQQRNKVTSLPHYPFQRKPFWFERNGLSRHNPGIFSTSKELHPLLGYQLENAFEAKIFQTLFSERKAPYIFQHVIGEEVIFPAAGFLEMILAAGRNQICGAEDISKQTKILVADNFTAHRPLHFKTSEAKTMQTLVSQNEDGRTSFNISVHSFEKDGWKLLASAIVSASQNEKFEKKQVSLTNICHFDSLHSHSAAKRFYQKTVQVGFNFGEEFQVLEEVYRKEGETLAKIKLPTGNELERYVCHPLISDALLQCYILHTKPELKKLYVPIKIGKFTLHSLTEFYEDAESVLYAYCNSESSGICPEVCLLNSCGVVVGKLINPELVATSVDSMLKAAGGSKQLDTMPNIYEVVWTPSRNHQRNPKDANLGEDFLLTTGLQNLILESEMSNEFTSEETRQDDVINELCYFYVLKCLYDLDWEPKLGNVVNLDELGEKLNIVTSLLPAFRHYVSYLVGTGLLERTTASSFILTKSPPTLENANSGIQTLVKSLADYPPISVITSCGSQLAQILQGNVTGQHILFGSESDGQKPAEFYYQSSRLHSGMFLFSAKIVAEIGTWIKSSREGDGEALRILEVGAGTGTFTKEVLRLLQDFGVKCEYHFTDISSSFFSRAEASLSDFKSSLVYKRLDIEKDPLSQGFSPKYFDIVVAVQVFHVTRDLEETIRNVKLVTRKSGVLIIDELVTPIREIDIVFGMMKGYWQFEDKHIRPSHTTTSGKQWLEIMRRNGFTSSNQLFLSNNSQTATIVGQLGDDGENDVLAKTEKSWIIFHDQVKGKLDWVEGELRKVRRSVKTYKLDKICQQEDIQGHIFNLLEKSRNDLEGILYISNGTAISSIPNSRNILEPLLHISKYLLQSKLQHLPKLHVVTTGSCSAGEENIIQESGPSTSILWGFMRCLRLELSEIHSKSIDLDPDASDVENHACLLNELWLEKKETEILFRKGARLVRRLKNDDVISNSPTLSIPESDDNRYSIELPRSKILSDLKYDVPATVRALADHDVEVEVRCASLNFKDVFAVLKPSKEFENLTALGLDFSGIITSVGGKVSNWNVGDRVFGCSLDQRAIASHVQVNYNLMTKIPNDLTFGEAVTLPLVFLTAWHCVMNVAKLSRGQTILVHAISGGVGLIAVQIAKLIGANVIGTAGSERKRNFVRSLGVEHVFNSRSLDYEADILDVTKGKGVDMVLNCLTGPGFKEASLNTLREDGHFIEISKLDIWQPHEIKDLKPNVHYEIVDLVKVDLSILAKMVREMSDLLKDGYIKPLPFTRYPAANIIDALTFLQKAKQIGKVIVEMPRNDISTNQLKDNLFNDRSTYLITGGRGAIGFAVAKWMISKGAKYLVLVGRSPPSDSVLNEIRELEEGGAVIVSKQVDIAVFEDCQKLVEEIFSSLPPLRGIHHCSGVLSDKLISNEENNWENFDYVLAPKVSGAWNLHQLTLNCRLECFVMYSSMSCTLGYFGQANYAAANAYLDSLAEMRNLMGLKGTSINWAQWNAGLAQDVEVVWMNPFSLEDGIRALEHIYRSNKASVAVGNFNFSSLHKIYGLYETTLLENLGNDDDIRKLKNKDTKLKRKVLRHLYFSNGKDREIVINCIVELVCSTLGLKRDEVDHEANFIDMGMDSLLSIEFTNLVQSELKGVTIGVIDMEEHGSVTKMTELIVGVLDSQMEEQ